MAGKRDTAHREVAELVLFSERLLQSIQHYFALSRRLARVRLELEAAPSWEVETSMVESFALHTRGLADFFFTTKGSNNPRRDKDAFALHYFTPPYRWAQLVGDPGPWLSRVYTRGARDTPHVDRFGALVAHLSYREPPSSALARGWPVMQLAHNLGQAVACFVKNVDADRVVSSFREEAWREIPVSARLDRPRLPLITWTRPVLRQSPQ